MKDRETTTSASFKKLEVLATATVITFFSAIVLYPVEAQNTAQTESLENITNEAEGIFFNTSESLSIEDAIENPQKYRIKESELEEIELTEESRRSNTNRGIKDYAVEAEIYDY